MMPDDMALVREYARSHSEAAFAALVERHVNLVYSVALRQVRDPHLAEEIAQAVFVVLARKAKALGPKVILPGWLCRTARYVSANALTRQRRRQRREQEACMQSVLNEPPRSDWSRIAPLLDDALARIGKKDHDAIVLRFFENRSLGEVGAAMGASEDTARMRVNRALVKLRQFFLQRGVDSTTAAIAETISANSILVAPATLAKSATAAALAHGATASTSTLTLIKGALKIMAWTKAKTAIVAGAVAVVAVGTTTPIVVHHFRANDTKMPYGITKTNLSANEVRDAVATFQRERLMWSHFKSLEGYITFDRVDDNTNHSSLRGHISVKQLSSQLQHGAGKLLWPFQMVISNNQEGWVLTSDGENRKNTKIDCKNQKQIEAIKRAFPEVIPGLLLFPKLELVPEWKDDIFPQGRVEMNWVLRRWSPWHNQNAQGIPDSYTFKDMSNQWDELSFTNGHLSSWRRGTITVSRRGGQNAVMTFGDYVESDHIWFPTRIEYKSDDERLLINVSNILINNGN